MNNENKYPDYIMKDVRQRLGLEEDDTSRDNEINTMGKYRVLCMVCNWNGLIDYGSTIADWIDDIYGFNLRNN